MIMRGEGTANKSPHPLKNWIQVLNMRKLIKDKDRVLSVLLVSPSILAVLIFIYVFIGWTVRVSLSKWKGLNPDYSWNGLTNYINLFSDPRFAVDIRNTVIFTGVFVVGSILLGFLLAVLLDQGLKGEGFFRSLFLFPMAISYIVTGVVWRWLMNPATGSRTSGFNLLFSYLHLDFLQNAWHTTPTWGIAAVALAAIWQMSGYTMALYLAGLRAIPHELREAAQIDGSQRSTDLPICRFATSYADHLECSDHPWAHVPKVFDLIIAIAGKQLPLDVPAIYMWQTTFDGLFYGRGAAISILLLISVAVLIIPYIVYTLKNESFK